ncbi:hypothetical protein GOV14_00810 [Candidatus Pacearchaeota archaeon]|nr:hypothetical protein [Candidatus Pacearchaeota archaeon]
MKIKKKIGKRGELTTEEVIKIVISVIVILALLTLAYKLFGMFKRENEVRSAEANLEDIKEGINYMLTQNIDDMPVVDIGFEKIPINKVIIFPKEEWYLRSYSEFQTPPPKQCIIQHRTCLCMCDEQECDDLVSCIALDQDVYVVDLVVEDGDEDYEDDNSDSIVFYWLGVEEDVEVIEIPLEFTQSPYELYMLRGKHDRVVITPYNEIYKTSFDLDTWPF